VSAEQVRQLLLAAFGGPAHPLAPWYGALLEQRTALRDWTAANATKIRKKARHASDGEALRDLRCELAVAAALSDRRSPLVYEPLAAEGRRGPDFLLRHKGHTALYVEVSRLRPARGEAHEPSARLAAVLCAKLSQLVAGSANLLALVSDADAFTAADLAAALQGLRRRADARDDAYFAFRGLAGARAFHQLAPRLSAVLVAVPAIPTDALFVHEQARHQLPPELARAVASWGLAALVGPAGARGAAQGSEEEDPEARG
jgi:hypothetical protein